MTETQDILPAETAGTAVTRFNALKHGVLSRYTVLPWKDVDEYHVLASSLADEHRPRGPTEEHLVEELGHPVAQTAGLRLAEAAAHQHDLRTPPNLIEARSKAALVHLDSGKQIEWVVEAIRATPEETAEASRDPEDFDEGETPFTLMRTVFAGSSRETCGPGMFNDARNWKAVRSSGHRLSASPSIPISCRGWPVTRCTWTASWNAPWPCCCGFRICGGRPANNDPFRKMSGL